MRISRRSPRRSEAFRSRFEAAGRDAAPIRQAQWLREYLVGQVIQFFLQLGFLVALVFFARSLMHLFANHGAHLNPWYLRVSLASVLVCFMLVARRIVARILTIRETWTDLSEAERRLEALRRDGRDSGP